MKNLQTLANELASSKMTLLLTNDMLNIRGGNACSGGTNKIKSIKIKSCKVRSFKVKSFKSGGSNKGGFGCGLRYAG
jgi:hypothetical protein